jgi:hypothetical protein
VEEIASLVKGRWREAPEGFNASLVKGRWREAPEGFNAI